MQGRKQYLGSGLLVILGLMVLILFIFQPGGSPAHLQSDKEPAEENAVVETKQIRNVAVGIVIRDKGHDSNAEQQQDSPGEFKMPQIDGDPSRVDEYVRLVLKRGGQLVLTRGAKFRPVATVDAHGSGFAVRGLPPEGFVTATYIARDITEHAKTLFPNGLPANASRALLIWSPDMQHKLEGQLKRMPMAGTKLKAKYEVHTGKLSITFTEVFEGGIWHAIDHTIVL